MDLKDEIEKMSEDKPYKIVDILEKILDFNNQKQKRARAKNANTKTTIIFFVSFKKKLTKTIYNNFINTI